MPRKKKESELDIKTARRVKILRDLLAATGTPADSWNPAIISDDLKMINYIRSLVDTWNPTQLNEAIRCLGFKTVDSWNPAVLEEQKMNILRIFTPKTATGNPIELTIGGNLPVEVTSALVTFTPKQSGTGDPSPSNIRPISGWDELTLTVSDGDQQEEEYTATFPDTIMGGSYDFVSGNGSEIWKIVDMGNINYNYANNAFNFRPSNGIISGEVGAEANDYLCSYYPNQSDTVIRAVNVEDMKCAKTSAGTACSYYFKNSSYTTVEDFKTAMSGQTFAYKLAKPTPISLPPADVNLLKGSNTVWTDGDNITLKYQTKL